MTVPSFFTQRNYDGELLLIQILDDPLHLWSDELKLANAVNFIFELVISL